MRPPSIEARAPSLVLLVVVVVVVVRAVGATWCIARSNATDQDLQTGLDYACAAGADCTPIQSSGLCYLPNTMQAHSSYAFNSFYQRKNMGPGTCDFGGTAAVSITDPSYGSCVYPSSPSTAGGTVTTPTTGTPNLTPTTQAPPITPTIGGGFSPTGLGPAIPSTDTSKATSTVVFTDYTLVFLLPLLLLI